MTVEVRLTGVGEAAGEPHHSLETLIFSAAAAALADAGLDRDDLDGIVIAASDMVDGRAISSMLTSGPAGAYLNEEINVASSPGHALALGWLQILSGTHRRLLVSSWGKCTETAGASTQPAERLSLEPFFERDGGLSALAATAMQAQRHRAQAPDPAAAAAAAAAVAAKNHGLDAAGSPRVSAEEVTASPLWAFPLRELECPPEIDGAFSVLLEAAGRSARGDVALQGLGWCADSGRLAERDLTGVPHLARAAADAYARAGVSDPREQIQSWALHDLSPDAEILAYAATGLCAPGEAIELALAGATGPGGPCPVNARGASVRGEAPFGGPLRKVVEAVRQVREEAEVQRCLVQIASGFAGQFQTAIVIGAAA